MNPAEPDAIDSGDVDGTVALLWGRRVPSTRGPKPALSIERIADVARRIADTEGLAAVSMQRVAGELDFTKMSLYRYVSGKQELLAVMIEAAVGAPPDLGRLRGGWRRRVEEFVRQLVVSWDAHPWLPWATIGERVMGPNEMGWIESALSAFDGTGLTAQERLDATFVLFGHIRNTQSMSTAGTQPWTSDKQFGPVFDRLLPERAEHFPAITSAVQTAAARKGAHDNGRQFGLRCLLDGIELLIDRRATQR